MSNPQVNNFPVADALATFYDTKAHALELCADSLDAYVKAGGKCKGSKSECQRQAVKLRQEAKTDKRLADGFRKYPARFNNPRPGVTAQEEAVLYRNIDVAYGKVFDSLLDRAEVCQRKAELLIPDNLDKAERWIHAAKAATEASQAISATALAGYLLADIWDEQVQNSG